MARPELIPAPRGMHWTSWVRVMKMRRKRFRFLLSGWLVAVEEGVGLPSGFIAALEVLGSLGLSSEPEAWDVVNVLPGGSEAWLTCVIPLSMLVMDEVSWFDGVGTFSCFESRPGLTGETAIFSGLVWARKFS